MRVSKFGNSLALRLPNTVVKALKLARLRELRRPLLPEGLRCDRDEADAR